MTTRMTILGMTLIAVLGAGACSPEGGQAPPAAGTEPAEPEPDSEPPEPEPDSELLADGVVEARARDEREVYLAYYRDLPEPDCIGVYDERTTIWRSRPPTLVEWQTFGEDRDLQWVIEYDKAKKGDQVFLDRMVIPCRKAGAYRAKPSGAGKAKWTYRVSVFACTNGKPDRDPLCVRDPEIVIWE